MENITNGPRIRLFGRKACPLCDTARDLVEATCAEFNVEFEEIDIDMDPQLRAEYGELVPVVQVDGKQIGFWNIDPKRLHAAVRKPRKSRK